MNDDFLYRLRVEPSPEFAQRLKARLDAQSSSRIRRVTRWGIPVLLFGVAFALSLPGVRKAAVDFMRGDSPAGVEDAGVPALRVLDSSLDDVVVTVRPLAEPPALSRTLEPARTRLPISETPWQPQDQAIRALARLAQITAVQPLPARTEERAVTHSSTAVDEAWDALVLRRSLFHVMADAADPLAQMVLGKRRFDARIAAVSAARIRELAQLIPELFARDTRGADLPTEALDKIWTERDRFNAQADELARAADALARSARTPDRGKAARASGEIFVACSNCHRDYVRRK